MSSSSSSSSSSFTESQRYDRQIRVWGAEAQSRIQHARVLLLGLRGLNVEVLKNLVLAGVGVSLLDQRRCGGERETCIDRDSGRETERERQTERQSLFNDLQSNFFLTLADLEEQGAERGAGAGGRFVADVIRERVQELNPSVLVHCVTDVSVRDVSAEVLHAHDVVLLHGESEETALRINAICRQKAPSPVKFFWSDSFGDEAIFFSDFGPQFQYRKDQAANNSAANTGSAVVAPISVETMSFPSLEQILSKPWKSIPTRHIELSPIYVRFCALARFRKLVGRNPDEKDMVGFTNLLGELLAANGVDLMATLVGSLPSFLSVIDSGLILNSSILGSFLSQEVIKAISLLGTPGLNVFVYNGKDNSVKSIPIV